MSQTKTKEKLATRELIAIRRSRVRIWVTYIATGYVFIGSAALIIALLLLKKITIAEEIFTMVLPVATGIITYWFASRKPEQDLSNGGNQNSESKENSSTNGKNLQLGEDDQNNEAKEN